MCVRGGGHTPSHLDTHVAWRGMQAQQRVDRCAGERDGAGGKRRGPELRAGGRGEDDAGGALEVGVVVMAMEGALGSIVG